MKRVFFRPLYLLFAVAIASLVYAFIAWIPMWHVFLTILFSPDLSFSTGLVDASKLLAASLMDLATPDAMYALLLAGLIGINTTFLLFFYRMSKVLPSKSTATLGFAGSFTGLLGCGCAACGSLLATVLLSTIAGAGFAARLPLDGFEFQLFGIALLIFSIFKLARAINKPPVCPI